MIYEQLLGEQFHRLHPKLQQRYRLREGDTFTASGVMTQIQSGPFMLKPLYLAFTRNQFLFPESGTNIPFTIRNRCYERADGVKEVAWERFFYFPKQTRAFHAKMTIDQERAIVKDYLGDPALFYSDLQFHVTQTGELMIRSGTQRALFGILEIGLPRFLTGKVVVTEGYDELNDRFTIHVGITNDVFGRMMMYAGHFTATT